MSIENEIKETMLVLESIMGMSNVTHREALLLEFVKYFVNYNSRFKNKIPDLTDYEELHQFCKIAELIESELERFGYKKDIRNFAVAEIIKDELNNLEISPLSEERMEFIDFLKKRWSC